MYVCVCVYVCMYVCVYVYVCMYVLLGCEMYNHLMEDILTP